MDSLFECRRSIRIFQTTKPNLSLIEKIVYAATLAPSACNLQLSEFIFVDDDRILHELSKHATGKINWAPACIIAAYDSRYSRKRHANVQSLAAAVENMMLAATYYGLGTCWMAGFKNDKKIREILKVPSYLKPAAIIAIGHPEGKTPPMPFRYPVESVLHINQFTQKRLEIRESIDVDKWTIKELINYRERIAPVYGYRFSLGQFPDSVYNSIFDIFKSKFINQQNEEIKVLDVFSYDCTFAGKILGDTKVKLFVSDYFDYPIDVIRECYPQVESLKLSEEHYLPVKNDTFDFITLINKLEFTPSPLVLLKELYRVLKPGGRLLITTTDKNSLHSFLVRISYSLNKSKNVYEGNRFYQIGPFKFRSKRDLKSWTKAAGFFLEAAGTKNVGLQKGRFKNNNDDKKRMIIRVIMERTLGYQYIWAVYKK